MHAFRARDIHAYWFDGDGNNFIATHLVCKNCRTFWHTNLVECYLCGEINYGVGVCPKNHHTSLTGSSKKCKVMIGRGSKARKCGLAPDKKCINDDCPTNKDQMIKKVLTKNRKDGEQGVFQNVKSSMKISQNNCLKCGNIENYYLNFLVFVEEYNARTLSKILSEHNQMDHVVIFKKRLPTFEYPPKSIQYASFEGSQDPKNWQPKWTGLSQIIGHLFS